jgi:hypothetical protein
LTLARTVAPAYAADPAVAAILVGGSVARGHADRWSDLELGIFWTGAPTEAARAAAAGVAGAAQRRVFPNAATEAWEEEYRVGGVKVDVGHLTVAAAEQIIDDVTVRGDPALAKQVFVAAVRDGVPLHGGALLAGWKVRAAAYPDELARAMVAEHLAFGPHWWLEMLAERDDLLALYGLLCRVERSVLGVLLGLNRVYPASAEFKWADRLAGSLTVAPPHLARRLKRVFRAEPREGVREAARLIDETVALVEAHLPTVDTAAVRARLASPRGDQPAIDG